MLIAVSLGWGAPVVAVQLLLINVVADGIPGFSLSREKADSDIMQRQPLRKEDSLFSHGLGTKILIMSALMTGITLLGFAIGNFVMVSAAVTPSYEVGVTMAFLIIGISSVLHIFNVRSNESVFKIGIASNRPLFFSALLSFGIIVALALIPPLAEIFYLVPLDGMHWLIVVVLSVMPLVFSEIVKAVKATQRHRKEGQEPANKSEKNSDGLRMGN